MIEEIIRLIKYVGIPSGVRDNLSFALETACKTSVSVMMNDAIVVDCLQVLFRGTLLSSVKFF